MIRRNKARTILNAVGKFRSRQSGAHWQRGAKTRMRSLRSTWLALRCVWRSLEIPLMRLSHRMRRSHSHKTDSRGVGTRRLLPSAKNLVDELSKSNPANTISNCWLPIIRTAAELDRNRPTQVIERLQVAALYELGTPRRWAQHALPRLFARPWPTCV